MVNDLSCWEQLGLLIAWEFEDPELATLHFLSVASYNLQHPAQFTSEALAGLRAAFVEHLDHDLPVAEIRRRASTAFEGNRRVLRDKTDRTPTARAWSMTIADVYLPDRPEDAAARVRAWAASIRNELWRLNDTA